MTEAEIGFWIMLGTTVFAGAVIGFHLNTKLTGNCLQIHACILGLLFYVGALMLAPAAKVARPDNYFFVLYPVSTVLGGIVVVAISTVLWFLMIFLFNRFVKWYHPRIASK